MKTSCTIICLLLAFSAFSQADNEIQVYASQTIGKNRTIVELHSNYTFKGSKYLLDPKSARWLNETIEITHGFANNFEVGFYTFTALSPNGKFQYLGNQIRPRITAPDKWKLPFGASLSTEFGFYRPDVTTDFFWQGEIRPIIDKTIGEWYFSFNPNIDFVLSGNEKGWGFSPQAKGMYTIQKAVGIGVEYYSGLGQFGNFLPSKQQEHLIGPMIDIVTDPKWEVNGGFLFGLTPGSNQTVFKLLLGRRFGK